MFWQKNEEISALTGEEAESPVMRQNILTRGPVRTLATQI